MELFEGIAIADTRDCLLAALRRLRDPEAAKNFEHNFRSLPFLALNLPFLYRNSIELVVHASAAQAWSGPVSTTGGWYGEAGIGFARIFDMLRTDLTWRFRDPQRLFFSVAVSTLF